MNLGDEVEIINYGNLIWTPKKMWKLMSKKEKPDNLYDETENYFVWDMTPEMIGYKGIIVSKAMGRYGLNGERGNTAWYGPEQLKLIK